MNEPSKKRWCSIGSGKNDKFIIGIRDIRGFFFFRPLQVRHYHHIDISDEQQVSDVFKRIEQKFGSIDVLANNAGISGTNRVNSVHPGYIWTPLVEELASRSDEGVEAFREKLAKRHPVGHVGEPDDIAYGILCLASDEAKFVTGSAA